MLLLALFNPAAVDLNQMTVAPAARCWCHHAAAATVHPNCLDRLTHRLVLLPVLPLAGRAAVARHQAAATDAAAP